MKARLAWDDEDTEDVSTFVADLGFWLHATHPQRVAAHSAAAHVDPWLVGSSLLRSAVLWACPQTASLILERLVTLNTAPADAFSCIAHDVVPAADCVGAATHSAAGAGAGAVIGTNQAGSAGAAGAVGADSAGLGAMASAVLPEGGLLQLALLSPDPQAMLAAADHWARAHGRPNFVWRWAQPGPTGSTPPVTQV
jgi:hypothetical protein